MVERRPRRRSWVTALRLATVAGLVFVVGLGALGLLLQHRLDSHVRRVDGVFAGLHDRPSRPSGEAAHALNVVVLTVGRDDAPITSDSVTSPSWLPWTRRVDAVQLLHVDGSRRTGSCVAIPLDTPVDVPGQGRSTVGAAVRSAKPSDTVAAIEALTHVRVDHLAAFDWDGFETLTDDKGGMVLRVPDPVADATGAVVWPQGETTVSGEAALTYLSRPGRLPDQVVDEAQRLQYLYRQLMDDTLHQELRKEPLRLYRTLDTVSRHLTLDAGWSSGQLRNTVIGLRTMRSSDIDYLTLPLSGARTTGRTGTTTGLRLDESQNAAMWSALREDRVEAWLDQHPERRVPVIVP